MWELAAASYSRLNFSLPYTSHDATAWMFLMCMSLTSSLNNYALCTRLRFIPNSTKSFVSLKLHEYATYSQSKQEVDRRMTSYVQWDKDIISPPDGALDPLILLIILFYLSRISFMLQSCINSYLLIYLFPPEFLAIESVTLLHDTCCTL